MGQDSRCNNLSTKSEANLRVVSVELRRSYPGVESFELCGVNKKGFLYFCA
jgi:hypothetical protein